MKFAVLALVAGVAQSFKLGGDTVMEPYVPDLGTSYS